MLGAESGRMGFLISCSRRGQGNPELSAGWNEGAGSHQMEPWERMPRWTGERAEKAMRWR
jgi:hypothetical protein